MNSADKFLGHINARILDRLILPFRASFGKYAHVLRPEEENRLVNTHYSGLFQASGFQMLLITVYGVLGMSSRWHSF